MVKVGDTVALKGFSWPLWVMQVSGENCELWGLSKDEDFKHFEVKDVNQSCLDVLDSFESLPDLKSGSFVKIRYYATKHSLVLSGLGSPPGPTYSVRCSYVDARGVFRTILVPACALYLATEDAESLSF